MLSQMCCVLTDNDALRNVIYSPAYLPSSTLAPNVRMFGLVNTYGDGVLTRGEISVSRGMKSHIFRVCKVEVKSHVQSHPRINGKCREGYFDAIPTLSLILRLR